MKAIFVSEYNPLTKKQFEELLEKARGNKIVTDMEPVSARLGKQEDNKFHLMIDCKIKDSYWIDKFDTLILAPSLFRFVTKKLRKEFKFGLWWCRAGMNRGTTFENILGGESIVDALRKSDTIWIDYCRASNRKVGRKPSDYGNKLVFEELCRFKDGNEFPFLNKYENRIYWIIKPESLISNRWGQDWRKALKETNWKIAPMLYYHEWNNGHWLAKITESLARVMQSVYHDRILPIFPAYPADNGNGYPVTHLHNKWKGDCATYSLNCLETNK